MALLVQDHAFRHAQLRVFFGGAPPGKIGSYIFRSAAEKRALVGAARTFIAREGFDPVYGARPLKRFLQRELETRIGRALIGGDILDGARIRVDLQDGGLVVTHQNPEPIEEQSPPVEEEEIVDAEIVDA